MVEVVIQQADVRAVPCDLLVIKYANDFYGADAIIANAVGYDGRLPAGEHRTLFGRNTEARRVVFIGVGALHAFRYEAIKHFGRDLVSLAMRSPEIRVVATTTHGAGYGLDEREAFLSLVNGINDGLAENKVPALQEILVVEHDPERAKRLKRYLDEASLSGASERRDSSTFGDASEAKPRLFVAMPFNGDYSDVREIAIQDAAKKTGFLCETMIDKAFVGDIFAEIKRQVHASDGIIAVLDCDYPNVFLELGYAMALGKPAILIVKDAAALPFDVAGQRCLTYRNINTLRTALTNELEQLKGQGVFDNVDRRKGQSDGPDRTLARLYDRAHARRAGGAA